VADQKKNTLLKFSGMAIQMAVAIGGGAWGGSALDNYLGSETKVWTIIFTLLGLGASLFIFIREAQKLSDDNE